MSFEQWLEEQVNDDDDPLKLERGTAWLSRDLAELYNEETDSDLSSNEVAGKLTWLRDHEHWYDFDVERSWVTKEQVNAWVLS